MFPLLVIHLALTCALAGLIWVVQIVQYPLMQKPGRNDFPAYHAAYTRRITWVVGPMMLAELGSALLLLASGLHSPWFLFSIVLLAVNWLSTAFLQVPIHRRLGQSFNAADVRRLVQTNWIRTAAWTLRAVCIGGLIMKTGS